MLARYSQVTWLQNDALLRLSEFTLMCKEISEAAMFNTA
jgi:hypothetical protein